MIRSVFNKTFLIATLSFLVPNALCANEFEIGYASYPVASERSDSNILVNGGVIWLIKSNKKDGFYRKITQDEYSNFVSAIKSQIELYKPNTEKALTKPYESIAIKYNLEGKRIRYELSSNYLQASLSPTMKAVLCDYLLNWTDSCYDIYSAEKMKLIDEYLSSLNIKLMWHEMTNTVLSKLPANKREDYIRAFNDADLTPIKDDSRKILVKELTIEELNQTIEDKDSNSTVKIVNKSKRYIMPALQKVLSASMKSISYDSSGKRVK